MGTTTKERTTAAASALHAAREKHQTARQAADAAQVKFVRAGHLDRWGVDDAADLDALETWANVRALKVEARKAKDAADATETELKAAREAYARERVEHFKPLVREKLAELDEALERARLVCGELQQLGIDARRDGAGAAFDAEMVAWGAYLGDVDAPQRGSQLTAWRARLQRTGWL